MTSTVSDSSRGLHGTLIATLVELLLLTLYVSQDAAYHWLVHFLTGGTAALIGLTATAACRAAAPEAAGSAPGPGPPAAPDRRTARPPDVRRMRTAGPGRASGPPGRGPGAGDPSHPQTETDVVCNAEVREEQRSLEDDPHRAALRG